MATMKSRSSGSRLSSVYVGETAQNWPRFSVVIPTFNRVDLLKQALKSVFAQQFTSYEVIVVDDGSTDSTLAFLHSLQPKLTFFVQPNCGPSAARNLGASRARGSYLAFLDSDDVWFPWTLERYERVLRETGDPVLLVGKPHIFGAGMLNDELENCEPEWTRFRDYLASGDQWRWFSVSSFVLARRSFLEIGGFSSSFFVGEDADLILRLGVEPGFVQIAAPATFGYREHPNNMWIQPQARIEAASKLIDAEIAGLYPGGEERRRERWRILARHVRPAALTAAKVGLIGSALALYARTFSWQVAVGAWRFLFGFPLFYIYYAFARSASPKV
jgi:glycosyltransferase involved in cell wall biosynthesis